MSGYSSVWIIDRSLREQSSIFPPVADRPSHSRLTVFYSRLLWHAMLRSLDSHIEELVSGQRGVRTSMQHVSVDQVPTIRLTGGPS